ncbi:alpha-ketoacid dehydrogenase subunit beta [Dactylosporangium roseum]|uniref:Alpha-ketoacid dehydrogenase subunit beta n=1 Tax=Dactylosporangium roseum TaxID=47989 RepID=A0ABY5ZBC5_9ACTN|nr:transketolase C-terminal domain-containing protein [Dactylosporangium roseum]UWZ39413.1 alpha-ketoacid dehydrogenase subunit beta [Dactylosporangium roseum]
MSRMVSALNSALHGLFRDDDRLFLLGEDVGDPYGGAFGATRGLSSRYPDRVLDMPISEGAIVGMAGGMALCGDPVIVEVMFGDFITLCFDPIVNFISKSVSMYGRHLDMPVVVRCPVGGNRGYGPTHSQSLQKHLLGVPNLDLYELSPVHDVRRQFDLMLGSGNPAVYFEDKVLYTTPAWQDGVVGEPFRFGPLDDTWVEIKADDTRPDRVVIAPGGLVPRVVPAMRAALVEHELTSRLIVPSRLFPIDLTAVLPLVASADGVVIVEDGVAGGGWSAELARLLYERLWTKLRRPIEVVQPSCEVIPAAVEHERHLLVQESTIFSRLTGAHAWVT